MPQKMIFRAIVRKDRTYPMNVVSRLETLAASAMLGPINRMIQRSMGKRVTGWEVKPQFRGDFKPRTRLGNLTGFSLTVSPWGRGRDLWKWVSLGVKPHVIAPKASTLLRIRKGYEPRTRPGGFYGGSGEYGGPTYYAHTAVGHPGIEPRYFEIDVVREVHDDIVDILEAVLKQACK